MEVFVVIERTGYFVSVHATEKEANAKAKERKYHLGMSGSMDTRTEVIRKII